MTLISDPSIFTKRIRHLSQALVISGIFNLIMLSLILYWVLVERPPMPYFELKPARLEEQQAPLADSRECIHLLNELAELSFIELTYRLKNSQMIENGYAERDLALACLETFHHFDVQRALPCDFKPHQSRIFLWKKDPSKDPFPLVVYPNLSSIQFNYLIDFARNEKWPLTPEGLFLSLKQRKIKDLPLEETLIETFMLSEEFWTVELLFNALNSPIDKEELLNILLETNWNFLKQFVEQQRQLNDRSQPRRQKFLLDCIKSGSSTAISSFLRMEWNLAKKLDDQQVLMILKGLPLTCKEGKTFAKEMLTSPRSTAVWKQASYWLYQESKEPIPKEWNYQAVIAHFIDKKPMQNQPLETSSKNTSQVFTHKIARPLEKNIYTVQENDSLWKIGKKFGVTVEELKKANHLQSDLVKPKTEMIIPNKSVDKDHAM